MSWFVFKFCTFPVSSQVGRLCVTTLLQKQIIHLTKINKNIGDIGLWGGHFRIKAKIAFPSFTVKINLTFPKPFGTQLYSENGRVPESQRWTSSETLKHLLWALLFSSLLQYSNLCKMSFKRSSGGQFKFTFQGYNACITHFSFILTCHPKAQYPSLFVSGIPCASLSLFAKCMRLYMHVRCNTADNASKDECLPGFTLRVCVNMGMTLIMNCEHCCSCLGTMHKHVKCE